MIANRSLCCTGLTILTIIAVMSLRRNQLKRMSLEQIMDHLSIETDPANIEMINSYLSDKNQMLIEKKTAIIDQLESLRNKLQKAVHGMNVPIRGSREGSRTVSIKQRPL